MPGGEMYSAAIGRAPVGGGAVVLDTIIEVLALL